MTENELRALPLYTVVYRTSSYRNGAGELPAGSLGTIIPRPATAKGGAHDSVYVLWHKTNDYTIPPAGVVHVYGGKPNPTVTVNCNHTKENHHEV